MAGFLDSEKLVTDAEGRFEVIVSPKPVAGNWLPNPPDGTQVLIRQVFSDWAHERPGEVHIDRIGGEGALKPSLTEADMGRPPARGGRAGPRSCPPLARNGRPGPAAHPCQYHWRTV